VGRTPDPGRLELSQIFRGKAPPVKTINEHDWL
jgi:hypothetical protein